MQDGGPHPPPPPPHGEKPSTTDSHHNRNASSNLPPGNYDIFVIPPHSSGSGFLYLPSLDCHWSSFFAGCVATLIFTLIWSIFSPFLKAWCSSAAASGNGLGIAIITLLVAVAGWGIGILQTYVTTGALPSFGPAGSGNGNNAGRGASRGRGRNRRDSWRSKSYSRYRTYNRRPSDSDDGGSRERTRRRDHDASERRSREQQEQSGREKADRDEAEARAKAHRDAVEAKLKEMRATAAARAQSQKEAAEAKAKADKEAAGRAAARKEADAKFAALKEAAAKKYAEKKARDEAAGAGKNEGSPRKSPYDRPRRPYAGTYASSVYSESSYTPSQSTARTSPPPTFRGVYTTKDPDKIVIKAVFAFNNAYVQNPFAQLVSGRGMVTGGLVLRITTEGLFIDDDVRGIPQREWDIKAWTMKLFEVWCPQVMAMAAGPNKRRAGVPTAEESEACVNILSKICMNRCRVDSDGSPPEQSLHVIRASLRDQEGKKYVFILQETEGWKVSIGLQRLRGGSQVRALGVSNIPVNDCKALLGKVSY